MSTEKQFTNGFSSWHETHFEVARTMFTELSKDEPTGLIKRTQYEFGNAGLYELAKRLTDKFESKYKDVVWGVDLQYYDTIEEWLTKELEL